MTEKDKWIDDIIDSAGSIKREVPRSVVFDNILSEIESEKVQKMPVSRLTYSIVATFVIVSLNVYSVFNYSNNETTKSNSENELISNYNIYE
ncbi:MAG: hypothetical protein RIF34_00830 [Candidatus Kapaibacterium sp.]